MSRLKSAAWVSGDPFHTEVRRQVALYFQQEGTDSRGGARVWRKAMLLLAWLAASWATFVFTTTGLAATMMIAVPPDSRWLESVSMFSTTEAIARSRVDAG